MFLLSFFCINMSNDCSNIKTGKFKLIDQESGITIITRTANEQIEINENLNVKIRYKVNWINECTYQLFDAKVYKGDDYFQGQKSDTMTVSITEVNTDYYKVLTTSNFSDLSMEAKIEFIK